MIDTKHLQKKKIICTLSILIQLNLVPIARKIIIVDSTSKIKIPVKLIRFLLCFLLLNESFKAGVVSSGNTFLSFKNSPIVCTCWMAIIPDVLWWDFVPKGWLPVFSIDIGMIMLDRGILLSFFLDMIFFSHISGRLTNIIIVQIAKRIQSFLKIKYRV